jgi:hypothetical protein
MRTNLNLDEKLLEEARRATGIQVKTELILRIAERFALAHDPNA